jgi:Zn-dependent protease/predicted transcriptional regulator
MLGWSFPFGKIFGVEIRLHMFFGLLLLLALVWTSTLGRLALRGFVLWGLLLLAVAVREIARALVAAWYGLEPRRLLLLPTGGLATYANAAATERAGAKRVQGALTVAGPLANLVFGLTAAALVLTIAPSVDLTSQSWVSPAHLVRALVWVNVLLAAVNLLPAWPLDMGRLIAGEMPAAVTAQGGGVSAAGKNPRPSRMPVFQGMAGMGLLIAGALVLLGVLSDNMWLIMAGVAITLGAQVERRGLKLEQTADLVQVREVMLEEYSILSASATLEDAVERARHTLQDVFPVVRGGVMVGAVARQTVLAALEGSGNGYVQGIMTREFQTAAPEDSLVTTLGRVTSAVGLSSQLVVVLEAGGESDRVLGVITPQNLQRSMGLLARRNPAVAAGSREDRDEAE